MADIPEESNVNTESDGIGPELKEQQDDEQNEELETSCE